MSIPRTRRPGSPGGSEGSSAGTGVPPAPRLVRNSVRILGSEGLVPALTPADRPGPHDPARQDGGGARPVRLPDGAPDDLRDGPPHWHSGGLRAAPAADRRPVRRSRHPPLVGVDGPSLGIAHEVPGITARHYAVEGYEPQVRHAMERVTRRGLRTALFPPWTADPRRRRLTIDVDGSVASTGLRVQWATRLQSGPLRGAELLSLHGVRGAERAGAAGAEPARQRPRWEGALRFCAPCSGSSRRPWAAATSSNSAWMARFSGGRSSNCSSATARSSRSGGGPRGAGAGDAGVDPGGRRRELRRA